MIDYEDLTLNQLMKHKNNPASWYWIGVAHMGEMDMDGAVKWLTKAMNDDRNEQRDRAILDLARYCYMADGHPKSNKDEALRLLESISNYQIANFYTGLLYYKGTETKQDKGKGRELIEKAISYFKEKDAFHIIGAVDLFEVALMYHDEEEVEKYKEYLKLTIDRANEDGFDDIKAKAEECLKDTAVAQEQTKNQNASLQTIPSIPNPNADVRNLMTRAWVFAEDGDWKEAATYFNWVLDAEPGNATAYLGLLCVDFKLTSEIKLANLAKPGDITNHKYYKRASADAAVNARLDGYIKAIVDRNEAVQKAAEAEATRKREEAAEAKRKKHTQDAFKNACKIMDSAKNEDDYRKVITLFRSMDTNYQDINNKIMQKITECEQFATEAIERKRKAAEEAERKQKEEDAARRKKVQNDFDCACIIMNFAQSLDDYHEAITAFRSIDSSYQDINELTKNMIVECDRKMQQIVEMENDKQLELLREIDFRKSLGLCPHCGGAYKGLFEKKCIECGRKKDIEVIIKK